MIKLFLLILIFLSIQSSFSQEDKLEEELPFENLTKDSFFKNIIKIGFETSDWEYTETVDSKQFMQDSGLLYGFKVTYEQLLKSKQAYMKFDLRYITGTTKYEGGYQDGTPLTTDTKNSIVEVSSYLGLPLSTEKLENTLFKPYAGFGYRYLKNPSDETPGTYTRTARYLTLPVGIEILSATISEKHQYGLTAQYDYLIRASTESKLSDVSSGYPDVINLQKKGKGYKIALNYTYFADTYSLNISPYMRVWDFEDSEKVYLYSSSRISSITEPKNITNITGLNIELGFY